jgi:serine phosphatase RsbU (regulator of sigma subunit)/pSer/pThr/pTyr-binding forkhead associated (FHA) protein
MAHLFVKQGRDKGERLPLNLLRTVLGRETKSCDIVLVPTDPDNPEISRKQAVVSGEDGIYHIADGDGVDRKSKNRTKVNDVPLELPPIRRRLENGDVIRICDYTLVFHDEIPVPVEDGADSSAISVSISPADSSVFLAQPAEKLQRLLEITNRLSHTLELDALLPQVVEQLLEIFKQAERGFLVLVDGPTGALDPRIFKARRPEDADGRFPTSIVKECLRTVKGVLSNDASHEFKSDSAVGLRTAMCAPLWAEKGKAFGALLLDSYSTKKPFTEDDLNLLMGVAGQASIALANARFHHDALIWERYKRDLALAREVVKSFLPERLPEIAGYEFFAASESALEVGGDYYDLLPLPGERLAIMVGDVAGKGVPASLVMARFSAHAQACLRTERDLIGAVRQLNAFMQPLGLTDRFITLAVLMLDLATHSVTLVNAGHLPPLLLRRATGTLDDQPTHAERGLPLGVADGYEYQAYCFVLQPGDSLALFSDGVPDATNAAGQSLRVAGVRALMVRGDAAPGALGARILQGVKDHAAGCKQNDDITLVCFGRSQEPRTK